MLAGGVYFLPRVIKDTAITLVPCAERRVKIMKGCKQKGLVTRTWGCTSSPSKHSALSSTVDKVLELEKKAVNNLPMIMSLKGKYTPKIIYFQ